MNTDELYLQLVRDKDIYPDPETGREGFWAIALTRTAALVRFAHRSLQAVSAHSGNGQLSQSPADTFADELEERLAARKARRAERSAAAQRGWQTRRAG
jgi:hypothetical protein